MKLGVVQATCHGALHLNFWGAHAPRVPFAAPSPQTWGRGRESYDSAVVEPSSVRRGAERCTRRRARSPNSALAVLFGLIYFVANSRAAEVIPPKPPGYFADYAGVVSKETADRFNHQLAEFERETSNQFVIAIWPTMPSQSSIEDFTQRTFQSWSLGQKGRNNGVVLFIFVNDHRMRIQPGYGLEGALPDITCDDIIRNGIAPRFRRGDYVSGLTTGIDLIFKAIRGEYKGVGKTARQLHDERSNPIGGLAFFVIFVIVLILIARLSRKRGYSYSSGGGPFIGGWSSGSGGGWSSGGGGGFDGFSGGGGSSGGGGASGSW